MNPLWQRCVRASARLVRRDEGQVVVLVAVAMVTMIGITGLMVDVGRIHVLQSQIQAAANAAALAAAPDLGGGTTSPVTAACTYGASSDVTGTCTSVTTGNQVAVATDCNGTNSVANCKNAIAGHAVSTIATLGCLSAQTVGGSSISCKQNTSGNAAFPCVESVTNVCNAIRVTETTSSVPVFMGIFGFGAGTVSATATASETGGVATPLDVQMILDSTKSMNDQASNPADTCGTPNTTGITDPTYEDCAKAGVQALLSVLEPCDLSATTTNCGAATDDNVASPVDAVGLMTFPSLNSCRSAASATCFNTNTAYSAGYVSPGSGVGVPAETGCTTDLTGGAEYSGGNPDTVSNVTYNDDPDYYTDPGGPAGNEYSNAQIVPFSSDYRAYPNAASETALNPSSPLVNAIDYLDCPGGTYDNGSNSTTSISGGGTGDVATASTAIGGGSSVANDASYAPNTTAGEYGIGGGVGVGSDTSQPSSVVTNASSIALKAPTGYTAGTTDLILVAVTARGLGSGYICAPSSGGWNTIATETDGSGTSELTQTTFWTSTAASGTYTFAFGTASGCGTATTASEATAIASNYTGVDTADNPIDTSTVTNGSSTTTLTAPQAPTTYSDDAIVSVFGSDLKFSTAPTYTMEGSGANVASTGADNVLDQATLGSQTTPATATTSTAAGWTAQTIALRPSLSSSSNTASSIGIETPTDYVVGDFLLVTVAAQNLPSGDVICPPSTSWTTLKTVTSGTTAPDITQTSFWTTTTPPGASEIFDFLSSCGTGGTPFDAGATAVALNFTGVNPTDPIDAGTNANQTASGTGTTLTAPSVTTTAADEEVVNLFATDGKTLSVVPSTASDWTGSASEQSLQIALGASGTQTASSAPNSVPWAAQTISLVPASTDSVTVARPPNPTSSDFLLVTVTAQGLGTNAICAPAATSNITWTPVQSQTDSGTGAAEVSQATFYGFPQDANSGDTYTFTFESSCTAGTAVGGIEASAIAIRYTGVSAAAPIDTSATGSTPGGPGETITATPETQTVVGNEVVSLYSTGATTMSGATQTTSGSAPATGFEQQTYQGTALGTQTATTATSDDYVGATVSLIATDGGCYGKCTYGVQVVGGLGTYYSNVVNEAQNSFAPDGRSGVSNAIILLSDGDATATWGSVGSNSDNLSTQGDSEDECQQAIAAAMHAEKQGTIFFSAAYGSESSGCASDTTDYTTTYSGVTYTVDAPGLSPVCSMELMADNPVTNASLPGAGWTTITAADVSAICTSNNPPNDPAHHFYYNANGGSLSADFANIGESLTGARLVSNSAT